MADPGFFKQGAGANLKGRPSIFWTILPKNSMKMDIEPLNLLPSISLSENESKSEKDQRKVKTNNDENVK